MAEDQSLKTPGAGPLGEISQEPPALEVFLDKHQMKLIFLAVILALGAVAYVIVDGINQSAEETAGALLTDGDELSELQKVLAEHEGTAAADSAKILVAEKQWEDGQQDDAIATLKSLVDSDSDSPAKPSAQASLGAKLLAQGKTDEAKAIFEAITENPEATYIAPYAWVSLGDIALAKEDEEAAKVAYSAVERDYPGSPFIQIATMRLLLMKAEAPKEIAEKIVVPETNFGGDEEIVVPEGDATMDDLIDAVNGLGGAAGDNPLLPEEAPTEE
ncbi:MAG: tetratricopeptide repeat protein [Akkermansiaceae bacterium]|jgi:predicted negative regulator of RcsB-dependent stress response|nr:tetratricopeptide repeat protein [Akkermansiaceae bacterium]MDP4646778.1 tetratricopeptide repeat protein [Akkermansiaceae bacterium]MDP4720022.1 tetratricopeptide repeat protein [Akkermansiaceae bacterium]MDP4779694.1 tetratricopeptide repeat protein [Akkermansiaceae bacterium]MDP4846647.1 tetratricopeptide repeat protein [Akkermansiaceae bacterium]